MSHSVNPSLPRLTLSPQRDWDILQKRAALHFFVAAEVPITELGTSNTLSKFTDLLTDLGSLKSPSSVLFLHITILKRSEPVSQTQHFPLFQTPLRLSTLNRRSRIVAPFKCSGRLQVPPRKGLPARALPSPRCSSPCPSPSTSRKGKTRSPTLGRRETP